jgi:tetratricopeptide (TPR) repeat protein/predicted Ser/Thr protein kinase
VRPETCDETLPGIETGGSRSGSDGNQTDPGSAQLDDLARGAEVGRYVVLAKLGAGAMGVVFAAYDPELDRKVALKLLRGQLDSSSAQSHGRTRLLREAQALARLSHPNVLAVYDVGTLEGRVWLAMEFIEGQTLTEWLRLQPRWRAVVEVMLAAGRGLEAAHAAGLLHRDFKPDNVMVSHDDRVRVVDFGLARSEGPSNPKAEADTRANPEIAALSLQVTQAGALMGTPRYMAPEQFQSGAVGAAADQFAFAVTLWEGLYGERPFRGNTVIELAADVLSGRKPQPPRGARVPSWLRRVCERGLATKPEHRYPSLGALLAELERGQSRARARLGVAGVAAVVSLGLGVALVSRFQAAERVRACEDAGAAIGESWNDDARARVRAGLLRAEVSYAQTVPDTVVPWLDRQAQAWAEARTTVCMHESVEHSWDADTLDRATWCLEERRLEFDALVDAFEHADATIVQRAVAAASGLGPISACTDPKTLARAKAPPAPESRQAIAEARAGLAAATALKLGGKYPEALARVREVGALDSVSSWPPLHAASLRLQGELLSRTGDYARAEIALAEAFTLAVGIDDWATAAQAASELIHVVGVGQTRAAEAQLWGKYAEIAIGRAGDPLGTREAQRLSTLGLLEHTQANFAAAKLCGERAVALYEAALGPNHPDLATSLGLLANTLYALGEYPRVREIQNRVLEIRRANLSPAHPDIAASINTLGAVSYATGDYDEAIKLYKQAIDIRQAALGLNHPEVGASMTNLCLAYRSKGMYEEAKQAGERALAIQEAAVGPEHPMVAACLNNLSAVLSLMGDAEESNRLAARALAIYEKAYGPDHPLVATILKNIGSGHEKLGEFDIALEMFTRSLAIRDKALGPNHPEVGSALVSLAHLHAGQGREREALPLLERAIGIYDAAEGEQNNESNARWLYARVLVATGGDEARAIEQARLAREYWIASGEPDKELLAAIDAWLAGRDDD